MQLCTVLFLVQSAPSAALTTVILDEPGLWELKRCGSGCAVQQTGSQGELLFNSVSQLSFAEEVGGGSVVGEERDVRSRGRGNGNGEPVQ